MTSIRIAVLVWAIHSLTTAGNGFAQTSDNVCPGAAAGTTPQIRNALSQVDPQIKDEAQRNCATDLIEKLERSKDVANIPILITFITLERPPDQYEKNGISFHMRGPWYDYPAIGALSQMGTEAWNPLIEFIQSGDRTPLEMHNAVLAILLGNSTQPELALSAMAKARNSTSGHESDRITVAIKFALSTSFCKTRRGLCEAAATQSR